MRLVFVLNMSSSLNKDIIIIIVNNNSIHYENLPMQYTEVYPSFTI